MEKEKKETAIGEILVIGEGSNLVPEDTDTAEHMLVGRYNVEASKDKQRILDSLKDKGQKLRLVVIDLDEKNIDGLDVLKLIRSLDKDLPIVVVSEKEDIKLAVKAAKSGADDYICKPITSRQIRKTVANIEARSANEDARKNLPDYVKILIDKTKEDVLSKGATLREATRDFEHQLVILVLNKVKGDRIKASRILGVSDISDILSLEG